MPVFTSIPHRIIESADAYPDRTALKTHDSEVSYSRLVADALSVSQIILDRCEPLSRVGIVTGDRYLTYCALLGIWFARCAYVPLHRSNPAGRNSEIISKADTALLLAANRTDSAEYAALEQGIPYFVLDNASLDRKLKEPLMPSECDLAYLIYTSGSTGAPKGVPITHANLFAFLDGWSADASFGLTPDDRVLQMSELSFDLSVMPIVGALTTGAALHVVPNEGIQYLNAARVLQEDRITFAVMVPSVLSYLKSYFDEFRLPDLRHSMFCGEALLSPLLEGWRQCVPNAIIQNTYGPTEATVFCTIYDCLPESTAPESANDVVPIGYPIQGTEIAILDETGQPIEGGDCGELGLSGPQVARGYWRDEERNSRAFSRVAMSDGTLAKAYRTGDIVSVDESGCLHWRMRKDSQVKIDGYRVELGEIEAKARRIASTPNVAVIYKKESPGYPYLELYYDGSDIAEADLFTALAKALPPYMQPRVVRRMESLPLNRNGKIDRQTLAST